MSFMCSGIMYEVRHDKKRNVFGKTVCAVIGVLLLAYFAVLLFGNSVKTYDAGHVFFDYADDTDYINPITPFVNAGGRVYFICKESYTENIVYGFCSNIAYIEYDTGNTYIVCDNRRCKHNKVNYTERCVLLDFSSNLRLDDQGWIYGEYHDVNRGKYSLGRYNLYNRSYEQLYEYDQEQNVDKPPYSMGFMNVFNYGDYTYFAESIVYPHAEYDEKRVYQRRYDIRKHETVTLFEYAKAADVPTDFFVYADTVIAGAYLKLYCTDLDMTEESTVVLADTSSDTFGYDTIADVQTGIRGMCIFLPAN